ncbi:hypothetical protein [Janthinobacterium sp. PC23-8]|uniref:hypothetical protein n=1 Tax=Janthinobacterium sp. PC23-8 TaxID=2012679 RepID=UPI000B9742C5|nr:hypothetical protein [Janthinobacterium sp. PC23-8]OYO26557.1 hypothetical protein CD932_25430 [Janthinobacterium sp. PC23-8]
MQITPLRSLALLALLACGWSASAAERAVTADERKSFEDFYSLAYPGNKPARTLFEVRRDASGRGWTVSATTEAPPHRGQGALCRTHRTSFVLKGAGKQARWEQSALAYYAWLDRGACRPVAEPVRLLQRVPDAELEGVLLYQKPLLARARLLMAGNTECAPLRALNFTLAAVDVGASRPQAQEQYALVFRSDRRSDRNSYARVWLRQSGRQYDAWTVTCPPVL